MKWLASKTAVAAGCAVILIVNVALLGAAAWNRQGEPRAALTLTERELALLTDMQEEKSGLVLSIRLASQVPEVVQRAGWRKRYEFPSFEHLWLDRDKLRELGFAVDLDPTDPAADAYYTRARKRRAYVVLEFEGDAWDRWLAEQEKQLDELRREVAKGAAEAGALADAEALLSLDRAMRSRLVSVDVGTDAEALRRRYPDRRRYAMVEGLVRPELVRRQDEAPFLTGVVRGPLVRQVNVPLRLRRPLEPFVPTETRREREAREREEAETGWPSPSPPRYRAVVAFGRRHEPWLVSVDAIEPDDALSELQPTPVRDEGSAAVER